METLEGLGWECINSREDYWNDGMGFFKVQYQFLYPIKYNPSGVTNHWTGLLDWNTGLDYWTDIFLIFTHSEIGFIESS